MGSEPVDREQDDSYPRTSSFLRAMRRDFPLFDIVPKRGIWHQEFIHRFLMVITLGHQRVYLTRYHTVLFGKLYVPDSYRDMGDEARYILLRHERVHLEQRRRMGDVVMAFVYLFPILPLGLAYGRARIEWEAYVETIRATFEVHGLSAATALRPEILRRFTGGDYGWMWPFPKSVGRWFDQVLDELVTTSGGEEHLEERHSNE